MKRSIIVSLFGIAFGLAAGCSADNGEKNVQESGEAVLVSSLEKVEVDILNVEGEVAGTATFTQTSKGVAIKVLAEGFESGEKAIHIHETAKCEVPDFKSAGSHFNPGDKQHGFDNPKGYHAGDLPNITIDQDGKINEEIVAPDVTLELGKSNSLLDDDGSALVIHAGPDDYKTDPAGDAGDRIACAPIKK